MIKYCVVERKFELKDFFQKIYVFFFFFTELYDLI